MRPELEAELSGLVCSAGMVAGSFPVSDVPHRGLCQRAFAQAEGGLCSWPLSVTRRGSPDQLF